VITRLPPFASTTLSLALCAVTTGICALLDHHLSIAGLTLIYLLAVVVAAATLPRWAGVLVAVVCVSALNFFFVPPRYSFRVDGAEYLLVLAVLLAVSLGLNALISSLRSRGALAELRRLQAEQLHALSEHLAEHADERTANKAAQWMAHTLGLPCAVFMVPHASMRGTALLGKVDIQSCSDDPDRFHPRSATWAMTNRRPLGRGCPDWGDLPLWCAPFSRHNPSGAVQLLLPEGQPPPDYATQVHWQALVRQIGLCVDREHAADQARMALDSSRSVALRHALLSSLSHDLRTPLTGILGSASTLREQGDSLKPAQRHSLLLNLENLARDMTLMADNTLQWARFSEGATESASEGMAPPPPSLCNGSRWKKCWA
jgi:two-component system, OmpR family, sensor histidine kinase KdpD